MPKSGGLYLEPFAGRGNVFFRAGACLAFGGWHLNDLQTASFFEALVRTKGRISVPKRSRAVFEQVRQRPRDDRYLLLEPYLTRNGAGYGRSGLAGVKGCQAQTYRERLGVAADLLIAKDVVITGLDWYKLPFDALTPNDFVYFDPPYLGASVRAYSDETVNHCGILNVLSRAKFKWMFSEYSRKLYTDALGKPFCTIKVQLACNGNSEQRTECVWTNYRRT